MAETNTPLFFITTDPLKATGLETVYENFHIVCIDYTPLVDILIQRNVNVFCYEKEVAGINQLPRNTRKLLIQPEVEQYILDNSTDTLGILMFKPNFSLHQVLKYSVLKKERKIISLNNSAKLSSQLENKLEFLSFCQNNNLPHPQSVVQQLHEINFENIVDQLSNPFVIQFDRGWFGNHTFFIHNNKELSALKENYTDRTVKISRFIKGVTLTNNAVITPTEIFQTFPFEQITDTTNTLARLPGSSIGNQWTDFTNNTVITDKQIDEIFILTQKAGELISQLGYKGFIGFDFLVSNEGAVYIQEINSRFTASAYLTSEMEQSMLGYSLLQKHLETFGFLDQTSNLTSKQFLQPFQGSRIVIRHLDSQPITISRSVQNGIYVFNEIDSSFVFSRSGYRFEELKLNEFQLFSTAQDRIVTMDQELFQLQSKTLSKEVLLNIAMVIKTNLFNSPNKHT